MSTLTKVTSQFARMPLVRQYKTYVIDSIVMARKEGLRAVIKKRGKKVVLFVVAYYTVRDTLVYIVLPLCVAKGIF